MDKGAKREYGNNVIIWLKLFEFLVRVIHQERTRKKIDERQENHQIYQVLDEFEKHGEAFTSFPQLLILFAKSVEILLFWERHLTARAVRILLVKLQGRISKDKVCLSM